MKRVMRSGHTATTAEAVSRTTFFHSVCQLVSFTASPKQPQSFTGLATANHSVTTVITAMKASTMRDTCLRLMANSRNTPKQNSSAERLSEAASVSQSPTYCARPRASR